MIADRSIQSIGDNQICIGCATCISLCPSTAIALKLNKKLGMYIPNIDKLRCSNCGICRKVCPEHLADNKLMKCSCNSVLSTFFIGHYIQTFIGYSTDFDIRFNSTSGGLVSQLLVFALENKFIDGALVTRMKTDKPLEGEPFIARTREDILLASKSKYCPVPLNSILKEIITSKPNEKIAVVGLPCHIRSIKKAELENESLRSKIVLHLGIFCSHMISFNGIKYFLRSCNIKEEDVKEISYRGEGWPGTIRIKLNNGRQLTLKNQESAWNIIFNSGLFTPRCCLVCDDLAGELADISFGDPWLPEVIDNEKIGQSLVISRTNVGNDLLMLAQKEGYIELSQISSRKIIRSQHTFMHFKKINNVFRCKWAEAIWGSEINNNEKIRGSIYNNVIALLSILASEVQYKELIEHVPVGLISIYSWITQTIYSLIIKKDSSLLISKDAISLLILNAHWNNRGDEAAIRAMIDSLNSELPISKVRIMILSKYKKGLEHENIESIDFFPYTNNNLISIIALFFDLLLMVASLGNLAFTERGKTFLKAIEESDLILHAPGGPSIGDIYSGKFGFVEFLYLYRLLIPVLKNKPVYVYAASMGPFTGRIKNYFRKLVLSKIQLIIVREKISQGYLDKSLKIKSCVSSDSALQNEIPLDYYKLNGYPDEFLRIAENNKVIGITITDLRWHPICGQIPKIDKTIIENLSGLIEYLIGKGYFIFLIPQLFGEQNDVKLLRNFKFIEPKRILIIPEEFDSYAQQVIISHLYCMIGMRYHSNIFAAKNQIPFISIYYEHKMKGFMEKLDLMDLAISVEDLDLHAIINIFEYIVDNYDEVKARLEKSIILLRQSSKTTSQLIKSHFSNL